MTRVVDAPTRSGLGCWHVSDPPRGRSAKALVALGHGAGGGVTAHDLTLVTQVLTIAGFRVARFEQPWRVAGRRVAGPPPRLDAAWCDALPALAMGNTSHQLPLVVGGRSAGARVACRTAGKVGAVGVLALAFPLHPPGRPERSRSDELPAIPVLVVQGGRDPFGTPHDVLAGSGRKSLTVLPVPGADHALRVSRTAPITQLEADEIVTVGVRRWVLSLMAGNLR
jgi:uncharacterized protein